MRNTGYFWINGKKQYLGHVYLIHAKEVKKIKIGFSTQVVERLRWFVQGSELPCEIEIICIIPGTIREEKELHKQFSAFNWRGEWFHDVCLEEVVCAFVSLWEEYKQASALREQDALPREGVLDA